MILKPDINDMLLYTEKFEGDCGYLEPDGGFFIEQDEKCYRPPNDETPEAFHDRLMRSIEQNKNLFVEDYEEFDPYPDQDAIY